MFKQKIETLEAQFRATEQVNIEISDEVLGLVTVRIEKCEPEKGQASILIEANTPIRSALLSAISGKPASWGYIGTTLWPKLGEEELSDRFKKAVSWLPPAWPIKSLIEREVERLRQAYAVAVCFEAHRPNRSVLEPMPLSGYSGTDTIKLEWERIAHKVKISGCLFAPRSS